MNWEEMAQQAEKIAEALRAAASDDSRYIDEFEAGCFWQKCIDMADRTEDLALFLKDLEE